MAGARVVVAAGLASVLSLTSAFLGAPPANRECRVTFEVTGNRADGNGTWTSRLTVVERCYDFSPAQLPARLRDDNAKYGKYDYVKIGEPTKKQDCAGYVLQKLTNSPNRYWVTAGELYNALTPWFATRVTSMVEPFAWGSVQEGDLVFYQVGSTVHHVAIVTKVESTLAVVRSVTVATKDNEEAVYEHTLSLNEMTPQTTDPLVNAHGPIRIYHLDKANLRWAEVERTCRCAPAPAAVHGWRLVGVVSDPDNYQRDEKLGPGRLLISGNSVAVKVKGNTISFVFPDPPSFIPDGQKVTVVVSGQLLGADDRAFAGYELNTLGGVNQEVLPDASGSFSTTVGIDSYAPFRTDKLKMTHRVWGDRYEAGTEATFSPRILVGTVSFGVYLAKYVKQ
jgi:hypothetical protein